MKYNAKVSPEIWAQIEWNRTVPETTEEISRLTGEAIGDHVIRYAATKRGIKLPLETRRGPKPTIDWESQDWALTNDEIAAAVGRSRPLIHRIRKRLGK